MLAVRGPVGPRLQTGRRLFSTRRRAFSQAAAAAASRQPAEVSVPQQHGGQLASWAGLGAWRGSEVDRRRWWEGRAPVRSDEARGAAEDQGPAAHDLQAAEAAAAAAPPFDSLAAAARQVLITADPRLKAALSHRAWRAYRAGALPLGAAAAPPQPARPAVPKLVCVRQIPTPKQTPLPLNVYMLHNLAHVELNAIDLAWDTVARFSGMGLPEQFYADFARVADDESRHLGWCLQRLQELGHSYGCMPAHNLLWEGAEMSSGDLCARLAIVPMSQEARGLDAGDRLAERLVGMGDNTSAAMVWRIAREEKAHVAVGVVWFQAICRALGANPGPAFRQLLLQLCPDLLKGPFNDAARQEVGLSQEWYDSQHWPEEQREQMAAAQLRSRQQQQQQQQQQHHSPGSGGGGDPPTAAAAAAGHSVSSSSSSSSGGGGGDAPAAAPPAAGHIVAGSASITASLPIAASEEQLGELRRRLEAVLATELQSAAAA